MTFGTMIAMCRDKGIKDTDDIQCIIGYFDGSPATDFVLDTWPVDHADPSLNKRPKTLDFKRRRRDAT